MDNNIDMGDLPEYQLFGKSLDWVCHIKISNLATKASG